MSICFINQAAGLGDIIFCQKIGYHFQQQGYRVIWPVVPQYSNIKDYIKNFEYPSLNENFDEKIFFDEFFLERKARVITRENNMIIPLNCCQSATSVLLEKYKFVDIDWKDWVDFFSFKRNEEKENNLYYNRLGLRDKEDYIFINPNFATPNTGGKTERVDITPKTTIKNVYMSVYKDFSVFDWCKVIENAKEIHTAETCLNYFIEKLNHRGDLYMYSKYGRGDFSNINMLFKKNWRYMK